MNRRLATIAIFSGLLGEIMLQLFMLHARIDRGHVGLKCSEKWEPHVQFFSDLSGLSTIFFRMPYQQQFWPHVGV